MSSADAMLAALAVAGVLLGGPPAAGGSVRAAGSNPATAASPPAVRSEIIGRSAAGRPIRATRIGSPRARRSVLAVGAVHGTELAGRSVARALRQLRPPAGTALWVIEDLNPDGSAAGIRQNARGVDLNRNFPEDWRAQGEPFDTYYSGPAPLSEPESRAVAGLIRRVRPRVSLWYHQALSLVTDGPGDPVIERLYAQRSGLALRRLDPLPGTAIGWHNARFEGATGLVVELAAGAASRAVVRRHVRAVRAALAALAPPRTVGRPIPYGARRRAQMAAYARRHYGIDSFRLERPRVIVQHFTVTDTFPPVFNTFAANTPDVELGELPGVCAHYVIDRDGTIYQLVPDSIMCRHTVGLNYTAIGIEHVGRSDGEVIGNRRQLRASLRLTRMLQGRHGIATRNVIGHNENRSSPLHRERIARLRSQTHGDFTRSTMRGYRARLGRLPEPATVR